MDECMPGRSPLDLAQADQVTTLKAASTMLELPERRVWGPSVEYVADCIVVSGGQATTTSRPLSRMVLTFVKSVHVQLSHER